MCLESKILVIDDEKRFVQTVETYLSRKKYKVDTAFNGMDGIEKIKNTSYDVVLTDLIMPTIDGLQVMEYVQQESPHTQIMVITGNASVESAVAAMRRGGFDYLIKPFSLDEMTLKINKALEKKIADDISRILSQSFTLRLSLPEIHNELKKLIPFDISLCLKKNAATDSFEFYSYTDKLLDPLRNKPIELENTLSSMVINEKAPFFNNDLEEGKYRYDNLFFEMNFKSLLIQPLITRNQLIGLLTLFSKEKDSFNEGYFNLLELVGNMIAVSMENSALIEQVVENEKKYRSLVETMNNGLVEVNEDLNIIYLNNKFLEIIKMEYKELINTPIINLVYENDKAKLIEAIKIEETPRPFANEIRFTDKAGNIIPTICSGSHLYGKHHAYISAFIVITDITQEKNREQSLKNLNEMKDNFLRMLSHDLRSPLNNILASTQLMLMKNPDGDFRNLNRPDIVESIEQSANTQLRLLNDIREVIILRYEQIKLNYEIWDIREIATQSINSLKMWAETKGISITSKFNPDVPEMILDKPKISQILNNVISNSIKFTQKGGQVEISIMPNESSKNYIDIIIADTGVGMSQERLKTLFEMYSIKSQYGTEGESGTGFGLLISKNLINLHKGHLVIKSEKNIGTTITISLPISSE